MAKIKVKLAQTSQSIGGVSISSHEQDIGVDINTNGIGEVNHDQTLKGKGTPRQPLGIADNVMDVINHSVQTVVGNGTIQVEREDNTITISSNTFVFEMAVAQTEWTIVHNLNKKPVVVVVDSADSIIEPAVEYIDNNSCIIRTNAPFKGTAYLN